MVDDAYFVSIITDIRDKIEKHNDLIAQQLILLERIAICLENPLNLESFLKGDKDAP